MTTKRTSSLLWVASAGLVSIAACGAAAPVGSAEAARAWTPEPGPGEVVPLAASAEADAGAAAPRCPYGALEDPHRGFVRCLLPDERDAGWVPPPPGDAPAAPSASAAPAPGPSAAPPAPAPAPPPLVEIGEPKFENGDVTKVEKSLGKASAGLARCIADNGGLAGESGSVKIQFLVRSRGRAEGVEVLAAKGVSAEAAGCVRRLLKNKAIGAPSADPVGVTVVITFKPAVPAAAPAPAP
jgi:hypothetical protein